MPKGEVVAQRKSRTQHKSMYILQERKTEQERKVMAEYVNEGSALCPPL